MDGQHQAVHLQEVQVIPSTEILPCMLVSPVQQGTTVSSSALIMEALLMQHTPGHTTLQSVIAAPHQQEVMTAVTDIPLMGGQPLRTQRVEVQDRLQSQATRLITPPSLEVLSIQSVSIPKKQHSFLVPQKQLMETVSG